MVDAESGGGLIASGISDFRAERVRSNEQRYICETEVAQAIGGCSPIALAL